MYLSIATFVLIGPLIVICGWVIIVKDIIHWMEKDNEEVDKQLKEKYNVRNETPEEEEARVEEYGLDDQWGILK
jgi:hypothetical protein